MNKNRVILIIAIILISFNLRGPLTVVGPLTEEISKDLKISYGVVGSITTIPLIVFSIVSAIISKILNKFGEEKTMFLGLWFIFIGEIIRSYLGCIGLFLGTIILGVGIAFGNIMIPTIIKSKFSTEVGVMTSIFTASMTFFGGVGVKSRMFIDSFNLSYKSIMALWSILTIIVIFIWITQLKNIENENFIKDERKEKISLRRSSLAWTITIFFGCQALLFYSFVAWLPTILQSKGFTIKESTNIAFLYQLFNVPASFIMPILAGKMKEQKILIIIISLVYFLGLLGFLLSTDETILIIATGLCGIGAGAAISLVMVFYGLRTSNKEEAAALSSMSQCGGYILAAIGPTLIGYTYDFTRNWSIPIIAMIIILLLLLISGIYCGKNIKVK